MPQKASSTSVAAKRLAGSEQNAETVWRSHSLNMASLHFKCFCWSSHVCCGSAVSFPLEENIPVFQGQNINFSIPGKKKWRKNQKEELMIPWVVQIRPKILEQRGQKDLLMPFLSSFYVCPIVWDDVLSLSNLVLCVLFSAPAHSIP